MIKTKISKLEWRRFIYLIFAALLGILLSKYCHSFLYEFITNAEIDTSAPKTTPLLFLLLALPTGALLWFFRTHDTRENIHQNDLFDALKMLTDDMVVRREIATRRLIDLTEKVPEYKRDVKLAFIKVLKGFPRKKIDNNTNETERRTYAQYILKWFNDNNYTTKELDLDGCIFDLQDFTIAKDELDLFKLFTEYSFKSIGFFNANLQNANLKNVKFKHATFNRVELSKSDLQGAVLPNNLEGVNFQGANLQNVDLTKRVLNGAKFQNAILTNTDFSEANIMAANFNETDLQETILRGAFSSSHTKFPEGFNSNEAEVISR